MHPRLGQRVGARILISGFCSKKRRTRRAGLNSSLRLQRHFRCPPAGADFNSKIVGFDFETHSRNPPIVSHKGARKEVQFQTTPSTEDGNLQLLRLRSLGGAESDCETKGRNVLFETNGCIRRELKCLKFLNSRAWTQIQKQTNIFWNCSTGVYEKEGWYCLWNSWNQIIWNLKINKFRITGN